MTILRDISIIISFVHVLLIFSFMFETRYSRRKTSLLIIAAMVPLGIANVLLYIVTSPETAGQLIMLTCTFPSLVFFYFISQVRDGRFFFTFCFADTISYWIIFLTSILDYYCFGNMYIFMLVSRLVLFPLLELFIWKRLRRFYLETQKTVIKGWWMFSLISMIYYLLLVILSSYPVLFSQRPQDMPTIILVLLLMPLIYSNIFTTLSHQKRLYRAEEESRILHVQTSMLTRQSEHIAHAQSQLRIVRHDLRHQLRTAAQIIRSGSREDALDFLDSAEKNLDDIHASSWCSNPVLDAVFGYYFQQAEQSGIRVTAEISLTVPQRIDPAELSTVFANALENAITACMGLPAEERWIRCKCLSSPQLMFQIVNPYTGTVQFDLDGRPVTTRRGHGIGTRSITAFCKKYDAHLEYKAEKNIFSLRVLMID